MTGAGVFVTGTDTGVGKTIVTAALVVALRQRGIDAVAMKPVESGVAGVPSPPPSPRRRGGSGIGADTRLLAEMCGLPPSVLNQYALAEPLAPALAAERAGVVIELSPIRDAYARLACEHELVLVEGAGGLLTPLANRATMSDLASALGLPVLIVTRNILGAINHTSLTVEAARHRGLPVLGVVLNDATPRADIAERTNEAAIARWGGAPLLGCFPFLEQPAAALRSAGALPRTRPSQPAASAAADLVQLLRAAIADSSRARWLRSGRLANPTPLKEHADAFRRPG